MISAELVESRFPVGSSASRIDGLIHQRARDRDALLLSAGELIRMALLAARQSHQLQQVGARALAVGGPRRIEQRQLDVLERQVRDSRLKFWKTNPMRRLRIVASSDSFSCATSSPSRR